MKFTCASQILYDACSNVQHATSSKSTNLPSIEGILIKAENDRIMLTGYDLEVGIITSVEGRVEQTPRGETIPGSVWRDARALYARAPLMRHQRDKGAMPHTLKENIS
jgi:DNA polymerase III sliding clamp (beta) subunit (PCNA family)